MKKLILINILAILFPFYALADEPGCGSETPFIGSPMAGQRYYIKNVGTEKYLNVDHNSSANNATVSNYSLDRTYPQGQIFKIVQNSSKGGCIDA